MDMSWCTTFLEHGVAYIRYTIHFDSKNSTSVILWNISNKCS